MKPEQKFTEYIRSMIVTVQHECRVCGALSPQYGICPDCHARQEGENDQEPD